MYPSSTLCRSQEELHRTRAATAPLANVRILAASAAAAWGLEAIAAERREARGLRTREVAEQMAVRKLEAEAAETERDLSENPDRGYEDA